MFNRFGVPQERISAAREQVDAICNALIDEALQQGMSITELQAICNALIGTVFTTFGERIFLQATKMRKEESKQKAISKDVAYFMGQINSGHMTRETATLSLSLDWPDQDATALVDAALTKQANGNLALLNTD